MHGSAPHRAAPHGSAQHRAAPGHGTDSRPAGAHEQAQQQEERDLALAASWRPDPELLEVRAVDSDETVAARQRLADLATRVPRVLAAYDDARAAADTARDRAREARAALERARKRAAEAARAYDRDKDLLLDMLDETYTTGSLGALSMMLTADSDEDLVSGMTVLTEVSGSQASAVEAADRSRRRLRAAQAEVALAERAASDRLADARAALAEAEAARTRVLTQVDRARRLLQSSVLADQAVVAAASNGYRGDLSFPLPAGAGFVDQRNWGGRSKHWASVHTGDDLSTPCGTPVLAVNDGTVLVRSDQSWSGPWLVMVSSGTGGLTTWYAHLQALDVVPGQRVHAGDRIGAVGQRGNATGCHLHLEVHPRGGSIYEDDTDPAAWLRDVGIFPDGA